MQWVIRTFPTKNRELYIRWGYFLVLLSLATRASLLLWCSSFRVNIYRVSCLVAHRRMQLTFLDYWFFVNKSVSVWMTDKVEENICTTGWWCSSPILRIISVEVVFFDSSELLGQTKLDIKFPLLNPSVRFTLIYVIFKVKTSLYCNRTADAHRQPE